MDALSNYTRFRTERIRKEVGSRTDFRIIWMAYKVWVEQTGGVKITGKIKEQELFLRLEAEFGTARDNTFFHIIVFSDMYEVEEYDKSRS